MSIEFQIIIFFLCLWSAIASTVAMIRSGIDDRQESDIK
jgi:ABC-type iron transport system FetAB permease component